MRAPGALIGSQTCSKYHDGGSGYLPVCGWVDITQWLTLCIKRRGRGEGIIAEHINQTFKLLMMLVSLI